MDANELIVCAPILNWMRVVTMGTIVPGNAPEIGASPAILELHAPLADGDLKLHRQCLHKQLLPSLFQPAELQELVITQMAAAATNSNDTR
jgi:hypothetical protein